MNLVSQFHPFGDFAPQGVSCCLVWAFDRTKKDAAPKGSDLLRLIEMPLLPVKGLNLDD
jgi:hypothetical protein